MTQFLRFRPRLEGAADVRVHAALQSSPKRERHFHKFRGLSVEGAGPRTGAAETLVGLNNVGILVLQLCKYIW